LHDAKQIIKKEERMADIFGTISKNAAVTHKVVCYKLAHSDSHNH